MAHYKKYSADDLSLDKYSYLDSFEGIQTTPLDTPPPTLSERARALFPGLATALLIALAAQFLSLHYTVPVIFFALLLGMSLNFLGEEEKTQAGLDFAARQILRIGIALLGARITVEQITGLGVSNVIMMIGLVFMIIFAGYIFARGLGLSREQGFLSGGAVAICGASAALAVAAILPKSDSLERNTIFTIVSVTILSTLAMIFYPIVTHMLGLTDLQAGLFLGGSIHDLAQVLGAGFSVSPQAGETATIVKLLRVAMLFPAIVVIGLVLHMSRGDKRAGKLTIIPPFLLVFLAFIGLNALDIIPAWAAHLLSEISQWCIIIAIAALGTKTSFKVLTLVGWRPLVLVSLETVLMAGLLLAWILYG